MRWSVPGLLALTASLALAAGPPLRRPPAPADFSRVAEIGPAAAAREIAGLLADSYQPGRGGAPGSVGSPTFQSWLLLQRWCDLLGGPGEAAAASLGNDFLAAMTADEGFRRALFAVLSPADHLPVVMKSLEEMWRAEPARWADYHALALALAVVRDEPPPRGWPHHQVPAELVPMAVNPVVEDYRFWIAANEARSLDGDLRRLDAGDLKFVVDAPVAHSELDWARKNVRIPRRDFERAFFTVSYRLDRIPRRQFVWTESPYTLENIRLRGGICVDQAYFAMLSGKARGLPTLFFTGQGADGGHAWFGYLRAEGRWELDCGRYANQGYAVGQALDPQTWQPITDHELAALAQSFRRTPAYAASQADVAMAVIFAQRGEPDRALGALDSAITTCPRNDLAWNAKEAFLRARHVQPEVLQAFHEAAVRQFANQDDLKAYHQNALAALARGQGDVAAAAAIEARVISQNRRERSDLSVATAAQQILGMVDADRIDDALREYRSVLRRLAPTGGGNLFYDVVEPLAHALDRRGRRVEAAKVVDLARAALSPDPGSILAQDLASLAESLTAGR